MGALHYYLLILLFFASAIKVSHADQTTLSFESSQQIAQSHCAVDWQSIQHSSHVYQWVDTRPSDDFAQYHINGSINLPMNRIEVNGFLKQIPLLIVDHRANYFRLIHLCNRLKEQGFKTVHILKGGMRAAVKAGYTVNGSFNENNWSLISSSMALDLFSRSQLIFVSLNQDAHQQLLAHDIPSQLVLPTTDEPLQLESHLGDDHHKIPLVIVATMDQATMNTIQDHHSNQAIYFLGGGLPTLLNTIKEKQWQPQQHTHHQTTCRQRS